MSNTIDTIGALKLLQFRLDNVKTYFANAKRRDKNLLKGSLSSLYKDIEEFENKVVHPLDKTVYYMIKEDCERLAEQFDVELNPDIKC